MKMKFRFRLCILAIALLAACQKSPSISSEAIAGIYHVTVTDEQLVAAGADFHTANEYKGTWQLEFTKEGMALLSWESAIGMRPRAEGPYILFSDEITFGADTDDFAKLDHHMTCETHGIERAIYQWTLKDSQLTLKATDDECELRKIIFIAQPWTMQP